MHCSSREVHTPEAHLSVPLPQTVPLSSYSSAGHEVDWPVQYSEMSHSETAGRHTAVDGATVQLRQHISL